MSDLTQKYNELRERERTAAETFRITQSKDDFKRFRELAAERQALHDEILIARGVLLKGHTHPELVDKFLRDVLANELLVLRRSGASMDSEMVNGIRAGLDTFARRMQDIKRHGLQVVYSQNYNV
jgi:hypothetical protein